MGMRRSLPKAFGLMRGPGGFCRRLYSERSTSRVIRSTSDGSNPCSTSSPRVSVALDVGLEQRVQHLVRRQRLVVALSGAQLGGRGLGQDGLRDHVGAGPLVAQAAQVVHEELGHVLDDGEAARGVAVEGGVADGQLALVAGGEHEPAPELVRERHQERAADAGLQVLLGEVLGQSLEARPQHLDEGEEGRFDGDRAQLDAGGVAEGVGVGLRALGRVAARHRHGVDVLGSDGVGGDERHQATSRCRRRGRTRRR